MRHKILGKEFTFFSRQFLNTLTTSDQEEHLIPTSPPEEGLKPEEQFKVLLCLAVDDGLLSEMYVGWTAWI